MQQRDIKNVRGRARKETSAPTATTPRMTLRTQGARNRLRGSTPRSIPPLLPGEDPDVPELHLRAMVLKEDRTGFRTLRLAGAGFVLDLVVVVDLDAVPDDRDPRARRLLPPLEARGLERDVVSLPLARLLRRVLVGRLLSVE